jgi:hypothetical protein
MIIIGAYNLNGRLAVKPLSLNLEIATIVKA